MRCHNRPGTISDLKNGIYNSCNTYFARTYKRIIEKYESPSEGLNSWTNHLKAFGLETILDMIYRLGKKVLFLNQIIMIGLYGENRWGFNNNF